MAERKRTFLLVHPDAGKRERIASALNGGLVGSLSSRDGAAERVAELLPDVLVAHYAGAKRLLQEVERIAPKTARILLCSMSDPAAMDELIEVAADGHIFYAVDEDQSPEDLEKALLGLVHMRNSARVDTDLADRVVMRTAAGETEAGLIDLSNHGAALRLPLDAPVERFVPGTALEDLRFERRGSSFMRSPRAFVRHIRLAADAQEPHFRVGIELQPSLEEPGAATGAPLRDPVRVQAQVRRAIRRGSTLLLRAADDPNRQAVMAGAVIENHGRRGLLRFPPAPSLAAAPHDVLTLSFDLGGQSYRGSCAVAEVAPTHLIVSIPTCLQPFHRRNHLRFRPPQDRPFAVSFTSPVTSEHIVRPVLDLHPGGLSFPFDASREVLPAGLALDDLVLTLPDGSAARCRGVVRGIGAMPPGADARGMALPFRCGVQIVDLPARARQAILDAFVAARCPNATDGRSLPFREIWGLMTASQTHFPDYQPESRSAVDVLEVAHRKLASAGEELAKTLVYRDEEGRVVGHAAGLRFYSRTWMLQHLAVLPGYHRQQFAARELSSSIIEYVEALDDIDFVRFVWRTENRWPNRLAGWVARAMSTEGLTRLRYVTYMRLDAAAPVPAGGAGLRVREARAGDLAWLEGHLRARSEIVRLRSEDLTASEMDLHSIGARYRDHGLARSRRILVVDGDQGPLAAALGEETTPGVCWPEITNAFSLVVPDHSHPAAEAAAAALRAECVRRSRDLGRSSAIALISDGELADFEHAGFRSEGRVADWTFHRSLVRTWYNLASVIFERLERPLGERARRNRRAA
jgi:hypothetical protein